MHTFILCHPMLLTRCRFVLMNCPFKKNVLSYSKRKEILRKYENSFSFLAKHISWKYIVLILILIYIILLTVPYLPHKTVSEEYKEKDAAAEYYSDTSGTERIAYITDNNDALCIGSV